jgi:hypothetical protein
LRATILATAAYRGVTLDALGEGLSTLATDRQDDWRPYTSRSGLDRDVPATLAEVITDVGAFADPALADTFEAAASGDPAVRARST